MSIRDDVYFIKAKLSDPQLNSFCFFAEADDMYQCPFYKFRCNILKRENTRKCHSLLQDYLKEFEEEIFDDLL